MMGANSSSMQDNYEDIIKASTARLAHAPDADKAEIYLERGAALFHLKRYEEALIDYNQATELESGNIEAYHLRAELYAALNRDEEAIVEYALAIRLETASPKSRLESYLLRSKIYLKLKKYLEAIDDYSSAIELSPQKITAYYSRAEAFAQLDRYEDAIADYTKILEIAPEYSDAYVGRARMYNALKQYEQAIEDCTNVLRLDEKNVDAYCERGKSYEQAILKTSIDDRKGNYYNLWQKAYDDYTAAIRLEPTNPELYICRAIFCENTSHRGRGRVIDDYEQAIQLDPKNSIAYYLIAKFYFFHGFYTENHKILPALKKSLELNPHNSNTYCLAYAFQKKHNITVVKNLEIENLINRAVELDLKNPWAHQLRAEFYDDLNRHEEAILEYTLVIRLNTTSSKSRVESYLSRSKIYTKLKKYLEAIEDYSNAIELTPQEARTYHLRAEAFAKLERYEEAIADYTKILEISPEYTDAYIGRARMYNCLKQYNQAIKEYTVALRLDQKNGDAYCERAKTYEQVMRQIVDDQREDYIGLWQKAYDDYAFAIKCHGSFSSNPRKCQERLYIYLGKYDRCAVFEMEEFIRLEPNNSDVYCLAYYLQNKHGISVAGMPEKESLIDKAIELDPKNLRARRLRAKIDSSNIDISFWRCWKEEYHRRYHFDITEHYTQRVHEYTARTNREFMSGTYSHFSSRSSSFENESCKKYIDDSTVIITYQPKRAAYAIRAIAYGILEKYQEAAEDCIEYLSLPRGRAQDEFESDIQSMFFLSVRACLYQRKYQAVVESCTKFIEKNPDAFQAYIYRAFAQAELKDHYEEVVSDITHCITHAASLESQDLYACRAQAYLILKSYEEAIADCNKGINGPFYGNRYTHYETRRLILSIRSAAYLKISRFEEALKDCDGLYMECFQNYHDDHLVSMAYPTAGMINCYYYFHPESDDEIYTKICSIRTIASIKLNRYREAVESHQQALRMDPAKTEACFRDLDLDQETLARAYTNFANEIQTRPPQQGRAQLKPARSSGGSRQSASSVGGGFLPRSSSSGVEASQPTALSLYLEAARLAPDSSYVFHQLGLYYFSEKQYEKSIESYLQAINFDKGLASLYIDLSFAYYFLENYDLSVQTLEKHESAVLEDRKGREIWVLVYSARGQALFEEKKYEETVHDYTQIIDHRLGRLEDYRNRAEAYRYLGRYQEVIKDCATILRQEPHYEEAYYYRAYAYQKLNQHAEAIKDYTAAINHHGRRIHVYFYRLESYLKLGQYAEAIEDHRTAFKLDRKQTLAYFANPQHEGVLSALLRSYLAFDTQDKDDVIWFCLEIVKLQPRSWQVLQCLGERYFLKEQYPKAMEALSQAAVLKPDLPEIFITRAKIFTKLENHREARDNLLEARRLNPRDKKICIDLGFSHYFLEEYDQSDELLTKEKEFILEFSEGKKLWCLVYMARGKTYLDAEKYENAIQDYTKVIEENPHHLDAYRHRVVAYHKAKKYAQAKEDSNKIIEYEPQNWEAYACRAEVSYYLENYEDAIRDYDRVLAAQSNNPKFYAQRGFIHRKLRHYEEVIKDYTEALKAAEYAHNPKIYYTLIESYLNLNRFSEATKTYETLLKLIPDSAISNLQQAAQRELLPPLLRAYVVLGEQAQSRNQFKEAETCYLHYIQLAPETYEGFYQLGICYLALNEIDEAIKAFNQAIALNKNLADLYVLRAQAYQKKNDHEQAIRDFIEARDLGDASFPMYFGLGRSFYTLGRYHQAIEILERQQELILSQSAGKELWYLVYTARGNAYFDTQEDKRAIDDYTQIIGLYETERLGEFPALIMQAYQNRAIAYERLEEYENASRDYTILVDHYPQDQKIYYARGLAFANLGQHEKALDGFNKVLYEKALDDFNKVLSFDQDNIEALYQKERTLYKLGKYEFSQYREAIRVFNILIKMAPDHLNALFIAGQCLQRQGENPRQAESAKEKYLKDAEAVFLQIMEKEQLLQTPQEDLLENCRVALVDIEAHRKSRERPLSSSRDQDLYETERAPSELASEYSKGSDETLFYRHPYS